LAIATTSSRVMRAGATLSPTGGGTGTKVSLSLLDADTS
jgi:hypothetical protein